MLNQSTLYDVITSSIIEILFFGCHSADSTGSKSNFSYDEYTYIQARTKWGLGRPQHGCRPTVPGRSNERPFGDYCDIIKILKEYSLP